MLKREIKFKDVDGDDQVGTFLFNLSKPELLEMEVEHKEGMVEMIKQIIKTEDKKELLAQFKKIILLAYGERSEDGKRFIKSEELRVGFSQTGAYEVLFMELATDDGKAVEFLNAIIPRDMLGDQDKPTGPPPIPSATT